MHLGQNLICYLLRRKKMTLVVVQRTCAHTHDLQVLSLSGLKIQRPLSLWAEFFSSKYKVQSFSSLTPEFAQLAVSLLHFNNANWPLINHKLKLALYQPHFRILATVGLTKVWPLELLWEVCTFVTLIQCLSWLTVFTSRRVQNCNWFFFFSLLPFVTFRIAELCWTSFLFVSVAQR